MPEHVQDDHQARAYICGLCALWEYCVFLRIVYSKCAKCSFVRSEHFVLSVCLRTLCRYVILFAMAIIELVFLEPSLSLAQLILEKCSSVILAK